MAYNIILVILVLTALVGCAKPTSGFYSSRVNGVSIAAQQSASESQKVVSQIEVNTREIANINAEMKKDVGEAERDSAAIGRRNVIFVEKNDVKKNEAKKKK
jgi:uncharacterized protein YcfL